jgi:hypothetical protein
VTRFLSDRENIFESLFSQYWDFLERYQKEKVQSEKLFFASFFKKEALSFCPARAVSHSIIQI